MKFRVDVTIDIVDDEGVTADDICDHVVDAVLRWGGQYEPEDTMFPTNLRRVLARCRGSHVERTNKRAFD